MFDWLCDWPKKKHLAKKVLRQRGAAARIRPTQLELVVKWLALLPPGQARRGQARFRPGNLHIHAVDKNQNSGCQAGPSTGRHSAPGEMQRQRQRQQEQQQQPRQSMNVGGKCKMCPLGAAMKPKSLLPPPPCGSAEAEALTESAAKV